MNNEQKHELCRALMQAVSEAEVVEVLSAAKLWDNKRVWRPYGDRENNFSTIGNQQNRPDAALVEKLVNSVDARLMHECMALGVTPESPAARKISARRAESPLANFSPGRWRDMVGGRLPPTTE